MGTVKCNVIFVADIALPEKLRYTVSGYKTKKENTCICS